MPPSVRPRLKYGSRDHGSGKCPKNQEDRSYTAHAMNFTAWCWGSDVMNSTSAAAFGCENLARDRELLDGGATDTVGSVDAIEAIIDKSQEAFGTDHDWVSVDTKCRPVYKFGDAKRKQALSKGQSESATCKTRGTFTCACSGNGRCACTVACQLIYRIESRDQLRNGSCDLS